MWGSPVQTVVPTVNVECQCQEAHAFVPKDELIDISKIFTEAGDKWRTAAVQAAGIYKGRIGSQADYDVMGDYLIEISEVEKKAFQALSKIKWNS